jgi:signal transduction histidine kinase
LDVFDVLRSILGVDAKTDEELRHILMSNLSKDAIGVSARLIDQEGRVLNTFGINQITNDAPLRTEVFQKAQKEKVFSEERFLIVPTGNRDKSIAYIETVNMAVKHGDTPYLWQYMFPKEEPTYEFQNSEKYFSEFANKVLTTLRYVGFTRARLYMHKDITDHVKCEDGLCKKKRAKYFGKAIVGHTEEEKRRFIGDGYSLTPAELKIVQEVQEEFNSHKDEGKLYYKIVKRDIHSESPWYQVFDGEGYDEYLYIPIFDQDKNIIMAIECDRKGIEDVGISDFSDTKIRHEEIRDAQKIFLRATDLLRNEYSQKQRRFHEHYRSELANTLANITADVAKEEEDILEEIVGDLYTTLIHMQDERQNRPKLEAMWMALVEEDNPNHVSLIGKHGNVPKHLMEYNDENYNIFNAFLDYVSEQNNKLYIGDFGDESPWKEFIEAKQGEINNKDDGRDWWYLKGFKSLYLRAIFAEGKLKAVLIFFSKEPFYLSRSMDSLLDMAIDKVKLILTIHKKNKERLFLSRELVHDLKSPLLSLKNNIDELRKQGNNDIADKLTVTMNAMRENVEDILMLSRIDNDKVQVNLKRINLKSFLEETIEPYGAWAKRKQLSFALEIAKEAPQYLKTDEAVLRHIIVNLLSNAIKYTQHLGSVTLKVSCEDERLIVAVIDNGKGVDEEKKSSIFELFSNRTNEYENTGMGLYIVSQLSMMLKYEISMESTVGEGSVFAVIIPNGCQGERLDEAVLTQKGNDAMLDRDAIIGSLRGHDDLSKLAQEALKVGTIPAYRACIDGIKGVIGDDNVAYVDVLSRLLEGYNFEELNGVLKTIIGEK